MFGSKLLIVWLCLCFGYNRYHTLVVISTVEVHRSVNQGKEGVVLANGDAIARIVMGATLTDDDVASLYFLTTPDFHAKSLGSSESR